ncbi:unnamed protein product [Brugia timori]|uniref:Uncharacterized protein n=1 Tax=Brugia timori TaxID=42155 RepID=A0A3P7TJC8_9BILA|nr:unnamed protein product [Brugia timori]
MVDGKKEISLFVEYSITDMLVQRQLSSGRSTPVIIPEPDLIAIDDELSTVVTESSRSLSPASTPPRNDVLLQERVRCDCTCDLSRGSRNGISGRHVERMRQAKQKAIERKELERKLFENHLLGISSDADKKHANNTINNTTNNKTLNMLNNAAKMKRNRKLEDHPEATILSVSNESNAIFCRSTAAGHFATDSKTKSRSKKTSRLLAGRNNDRKVKVNTLN